MTALSKLNYYRRVFRAYSSPEKSQLSFWHDSADINSRITPQGVGEYYMNFAGKANYASHVDESGVPLLNYHGSIGLQYNPIAIAQWGLGNFNIFRRRGDEAARQKFLLAADWLCDHLESNAFGVHVWNHHFDWEYRTQLRAPWYSGLAQGQGISLLVRAYSEFSHPKYMAAATLAFHSFLAGTDAGGVTFIDRQGDMWFEEYIVSPPTHILNGFIWAIWGIYDYFLVTRAREARRLFDAATKTLLENLHSYDLGFWSLYEQSGTLLPMIASPFYHRLHITQLQVMYELTHEPVFSEFAQRWRAYGRSRSKRTRALCYKGAFKLCYY